MRRFLCSPTSRRIGGAPAITGNACGDAVWYALMALRRNFRWAFAPNRCLIQEHRLCHVVVHQFLFANRASNVFLKYLTLFFGRIFVVSHATPLRITSSLLAGGPILACDIPSSPLPVPWLGLPSTAVLIYYVALQLLVHLIQRL